MTTALPSRSVLDGSGSPLTSEMKSALGSIHDYLSGLFGTTGLAEDARTALGTLGRFSSGDALPTSNIGPIWHDDYNSIMTWQAFTANGASYTGYASVLVGGLLIETQPTPRAGYIRSGVTNLSRTAYAALRGWAMHNGIMVASGTWAAGTVAIKDNVDGTTFTAFDVRGEFPRFWDDSRGVNPGRAALSWEGDLLKDHSHKSAFADAGAGYTYRSYSSANNITAYVDNHDPMLNGGAETRPRNTAFLATIKI